MSNETEVEDQTDAEEMEKLIALEAEEKKAKAAESVQPETPSPEPVDSQAPEVVPVQADPVTPNPSEAEKPKDDPMKWAEKKGYKSPEDMARALLQKDQEYHQSRQKAERETPPAPPAPAWQPAPQMGYGYPPPPAYGYPPPVNGDLHRQLGQTYGMDPDDVRRVMPMVMDAAEAIYSRKTAGLERELTDIRRTTMRNNELMTLMQDPAFRDESVQREIHAVFDSNPALFQRPDAYTEGFNRALANMHRKQLQQRAVPETRNQNPPVTAGGGNGSTNTTPTQITDAMVASWSEADQLAFFASNGKRVPKK